MPRGPPRGTWAARRTSRARRRGSRRARRPGRCHWRVRRARRRSRRTRSPRGRSPGGRRSSGRGGRRRRARAPVPRPRRASPADRDPRAGRGPAPRRAEMRRTARRPRPPQRSRRRRAASARRTARSARRVEIEGQRLGTLLSAVMGGLHRDLLAPLSLLERTAYVEAELELRRRVEQRLRGREPEDAHEIVVQAVEAFAVLVIPHDVGIGRRTDALARRTAYLALRFAEIERTNDSTGIAVSVSMEIVPRAPRLTDTRAIVSESLASTTLTKS